MKSLKDEVNFSLRDKVVLITGSSIGIGAETAYQFSKEGSKVIITYYKDKKEAEKVAKKCKDLGAADILVLPFDVMDDASIKDCVQVVIDKFGRIDILINNAGVYHGNILSEQSLEDIKVEIRTNLEGLIKMTRECLPYITEMIINIASRAGLRPYGGSATYSATKFGVRGFSQSLAQELSNIKVYVVNPTSTATRMADFSGQPVEEVAEIILNTVKGKYKLPSGSDINVWEL